MKIFVLFVFSLVLAASILALLNVNNPLVQAIYLTVACFTFFAGIWIATDHSF